MILIISSPPFFKTLQAALINHQGSIFKFRQSYAGPKLITRQR